LRKGLTKQIPLKKGIHKQNTFEKGCSQKQVPLGKGWIKQQLTFEKGYVSHACFWPKIAAATAQKLRYK
jgi:hypothetical protein